MKEFTKKISLWLAALLLLSWLFQQSVRVDVDSYLRTIQSFEQVRQHDALLNQQVLQLRYGQLKNDDTITASQHQITTVLNALQQEEPQFFSDDSTIQQEFMLFRKLFSQKTQLIEKFKLKNSLLRDSIEQFPTASESLLNQVGPQSVYALPIRALRENVLVYERIPSAELKTKIQQMLKALQTASNPNDNALNHLAKQINTILANQVEVDELTIHIAQLQTIEQADKVFKIYSELFTLRDHQAAYYKLAMALLSVFMLIYLAWTFTRLQSTSQTLNNSLRELEFEKFALDQHSIVSITDAHGKIIYCNDRFSHISQYSRDELLGKDHRIVNSGHHPREYFKAMWETIQNGQVWHGEVKNRRKDGSYYWVESTIVPFLESNGKPSRYISIRTDITANKALSEEMQIQRAFYENITETLGEGLYVQNAKGVCIYMNSEAEKLLGWTRQEFIGKPVHNTIHTQTATGEDLPAHDCPIMNEVLKHGEAYMDNQVFVRKDGSTFPVAVSSRATYDQDGSISSTVVAFQDISGRKEAEAAVVNAKEVAERANNVKSDFLANMSHEIRTPMNGIIGMTELALETDLNQDQRELLNIIKSSADALIDIINDILDFSKIESGKMDIDVVYFSLGQMLRDSVKIMATRAHQKKLELLLHVSPDVPDRIIGDPGRLRQVILNLVGNAIKFTDSGEIEICVKKIDGALTGNAKLEFSVRDTGIGIPEEKFQTIFESFSQADTSITRKYGGTGLGLSISNKIISMMGGQIKLKSKVGEGSTFHFNIDVPVISEDHTKKRHHQGQMRGMRVLVADDNLTNQTILEEILLSWGMSPTLVASGKEALSELERASDAGNPYAVVVLDVQMPEMSGFELVENMRNTPEHAPATVMMLTSAGQRGDAARCRELGIASYLMKPISQSDLFDAMMLALGATSQNDPNNNDTTLITRHTLRETKRKFNLLLAEDNDVNQTIAVRKLENLGHQVTIANNGIEAIQQWENGEFDAILMDVDMPLMGGFEATKKAD
jgi:PAS domain S-box-containing protein